MPGRPSREFRKLGLRPAPDYFAASKVQAARIAIHSDPVPGRNDLVADLRALGFRINSQRAAADNAGLAHLARDQRSMRGAGADRCHDGSRRSEAGNVGGAGIGSQQDRGFAGSPGTCPVFGAMAFIGSVTISISACFFLGLAAFGRSIIASSGRRTYLSLLHSSFWNLCSLPSWPP